MGASRPNRLVDASRTCGGTSPSTCYYFLLVLAFEDDRPSKIAARCQAPYRYSEQKNRLTKGQISLVRQIAAQITKVNLWKINITKPDILFFLMPNNKHLASFVDFIMTLRWDPFDGTIFLHTIKLALHIHIT